VRTEDIEPTIVVVIEKGDTRRLMASMTKSGALGGGRIQDASLLGRAMSVIACREIRGRPEGFPRGNGLHSEAGWAIPEEFDRAEPGQAGSGEKA